LLDLIEASEMGLAAMKQEVAESKRLLYVSLTRPRDGLIITMDNKKTSGPWMDALGARWMITEGENLTLPNGTDIPSRVLDLEADDPEIKLPEYAPTWLASTAPRIDKLPLHLSPSSIAPLDSARIGEVIELGERLEINGEYEPAKLGSALHATIATALLGQNATERVLRNYDMQDTISSDTADECVRRLLKAITDRFSPVSYYIEHPIQYMLETGQLVSGWIDLLLETDDGFILIDHKASPRARSDWNEIALSYSGQLEAYAGGVTRVTDKPVISRWIHFAVMGGLVEVVRSENRERV